MEISKALTLDHISKAAGDDTRAINFGEGTPTFPPPDIFTNTVTRMIELDDRKGRQYFEDNTKTAILDYLKDHWRSIELLPENILLDTGADDLLSHLLKSMLKPEDEVATFVPNYLHFYNTLTEMKVKVAYIHKVESYPSVTEG
jgi:aspartate/methionine/tyrosine aminotransferase